MANVPELSGAAEVAELPGGLTNTNYKVTTTSGAYVVRVSAKDASLLSIDRENEYLNTVAAADAGVGAPVTAYLPEENVLVRPGAGSIRPTVMLDFKHRLKEFHVFMG